jgi:hypothetical protein
MGEEKPEEELMGNIVDAILLCASLCNLFFYFVKKTTGKIYQQPCFLKYMMLKY